MNATSSRAHTVVTITFDQFIKNDAGENKKSSVMNLVDLAGACNRHIRLFDYGVTSSNCVLQDLSERTALERLVTD